MNVQTRLEDPARIALAAKRGQGDAGTLRGNARLLYENLTERELAEMAELAPPDLRGQRLD
ncbi:DUF3008 family protein [Halodurantibacterium flavum]|uniref:DUF3008 family protein n=1 Tax=Halodurantibacterium flavum TaxID=1382802 RepID=A0ABW4S5Y9_9RHOB